MACEPSLVKFASREAMAARVADLVELAIVSAAMQNGMSEIAVSGGSTPLAMYENLAARELDWKKHHLTLVDERWVPLDHPRSNEAVIRKAFMAAQGVHITGLYNNSPTLADGLAIAQNNVDAYRKQFDAVILGMGDDGHSASWFPHAAGLDAALKGEGSLAAIRAVRNAITGDEVDRMTLTLSTVRDARIIVLMLVGEEKRAAFQQAVQPGPIEDMPVRAVLHARPDLWVCWAP